jgi:hypothetical protein
MSTQRYVAWVVSDSISQGYNDAGALGTGQIGPGLRGLGFRLARSLGNFSGTNPAWTILNMGMSGWTPEQYFNRAKRIYAGTPSADRPTLIIHQVWSPNGLYPTYGGLSGAVDQTLMLSTNGLWQTALAAETYWNSLGVAFMPQLHGASLYLTGNGGIYQTYTRDNIIYPAVSRWGSKLLASYDLLQDPATDFATVGQTWSSTYSDSSDFTHIWQPGWDAIENGGDAVMGATYPSRMPNSTKTLGARFLNCCTALGVV